MDDVFALALVQFGESSGGGGDVESLFEKWMSNVDATSADRKALLRAIAGVAEPTDEMKCLFIVLSAMMMDLRYTEIGEDVFEEMAGVGTLWGMLSDRVRRQMVSVTSLRSYYGNSLHGMLLGHVIDGDHAFVCHPAGLSRMGVAINTALGRTCLTNFMYRKQQEGHEKESEVIESAELREFCVTTVLPDDTTHGNAWQLLADGGVETVVLHGVEYSVHEMVVQTSMKAFLAHGP